MSTTTSSCPCSTVRLTFTNPTATVRRAELHFGIPYYRSRGVEHDVLNANDSEFAFIEIEILEPQGR